MPALPARARAAMRSLLSRPQPSSARMSTATASNCSESSALSGRPGVPVIGGSTSSSRAQHHHARSSGPRQRPNGGSSAGRALDRHPQPGAVLGEPPLAAGGGDHPIPVLRPGGRGRSRLRGGPDGGDVQGSRPVLKPAEAIPLQRLGGLLVGDLAQRQPQPREVVDIHDLRLRARAPPPPLPPPPSSLLPPPP